MSYRFAYPNVMSAGYDYERSYSPESFSSESDESDEYEYRGRMITRETRRPRDIVRAPTPPPIIKRVVERAPTPEAPVMERVIIRPQAQEIVERVIEQPCTPPPRIVQKEMQEEAPPPIVRTRVIKVDRPVQCGFSQPSSPYGHVGNVYRAQSIAGSVGRPTGFPDHNPDFSSVSTFEYMQPQPPMMMMPTSPQQMMYQSVPSYMYPAPQHAMPFGYRPMMRMMPMPMMSSAGSNLVTLPRGFPNQQPFFNPMAQQLVY